LRPPVGSGRKLKDATVAGGLANHAAPFATEVQRWFLCDLRDMLRDRQTRLNSLGEGNQHCIDVPVALRIPGWPSKIRGAGFDSGQSTLVILEGVSMYLSEADLRRTLESIRELCENRASRLWLDHVTETLLGMQRPEVQSFLSSMTRLGEPFLTGFLILRNFSGTRCGGSLNIVPLPKFSLSTSRSIMSIGSHCCARQSNPFHASCAARPIPLGSSVRTGGGSRNYK
jgi:hypothetical protein